MSHRGPIFAAVGRHIISKSRFPPKTGRMVTLIMTAGEILGDSGDVYLSYYIINTGIYILHSSKINFISL